MSGRVSLEFLGRFGAFLAGLALLFGVRSHLQIVVLVGLVVLVVSLALLTPIIAGVDSLLGLLADGLQPGASSPPRSSTR